MPTCKKHSEIVLWVTRKKHINQIIWHKVHPIHIFKKIVRWVTNHLWGIGIVHLCVLYAIYANYNMDNYFSCNLICHRFLCIRPVIYSFIKLWVLNMTGTINARWLGCSSYLKVSGKLQTCIRYPKVILTRFYI